MPDDVIPETIADVVEDAPLPDHTVRPPWVDDIIHAVESIPDAITAALPPPVPVDAADDVVEPVIPEEHHEPPEPDVTPESKPWTHKLPFSK